MISFSVSLRSNRASLMPKSFQKGMGRFTKVFHGASPHAPISFEGVKPKAALSVTVCQFARSFPAIKRMFDSGNRQLGAGSSAVSYAGCILLTHVLSL